MSWKDHKPTFVQHKLVKNPAWKWWKLWFNKVTRYMDGGPADNQPVMKYRKSRGKVEYKMSIKLDD